MDETPDLSKAVEVLQEMLSDEKGQNQIQNILSSFTSLPEGPEGDKESPSANGDIFSALGNMDFDTIMKIQRVMQMVGNEAQSPRMVFLNSLKPFLKDSRREKVEKAANILKIASVIKAFKPWEGGDFHL